MTSARDVLAISCLLVVSGCTLSYRHTRHASTHTREDGRQLEIEGQGNAAHLGATFDFRYFRFSMPFEASYRVLNFRDESGSQDRQDIVHERRFYRLDVPVLSMWDLNDGGIGYPGVMRHRRSLEFWISAESDFMTEHEWWVDGGLVYYSYNGVGLRLHVGTGGVPFRAATPQRTSRFPILWDGQAPMFGAGLEITFTSGEYGLEVVEYLIGIDKRHRDRSRRYGWD